MLSLFSNFLFQMTTLFQRITSVLLCGVLGIWATPARAQAWEWMRGDRAAVTVAPAADTYTSIRATAITSSGDVYAAYWHNGALTLGTQTYTAAPFYGGVLARYTAGGTLVSTLLNAHDGAVTDLVVDSADNLYATGYFKEQLTIGGTQFTALDTADYFLAKWNAAGTLLWMRQIQNEFSHYFPTSYLRGGGNTQIALDGAGNVIICGEYQGRINENGQQILFLDTFSQCFFMAKYDVNGTKQWLRGAGEILGYMPSLYVSDLAAAPDGTLQVVGYNTDFDFYWGTTLIARKDNHSGFWLKINANGDLLDHSTFGDLTLNGFSWASVATDADGSTYVATSVENGALEWDSTVFQLPAGRLQGAVVLKLGAGGTPQWVQSLSLLAPTGTRSTPLRGAALCVGGVPAGSSPHVYIGGAISSSPGTGFLTCGSLSMPVNPANRTDSYILSLDGDSGTPIWLLPRGASPENDGVSALAVNDAGMLSVAGSYTGTTAIGGVTLPGAPLLYSAFLGRMIQQYNVVQGTAFTDANANGTRDAGEPGRGEVVVAAQPGDFFFTTEAGGQYSAITDLSASTLSIPVPPLYYTAVALDPTAGPFATYGSLSRGHDFALQPLVNRQDLTLVFTPIGRARPGFPVRYRLTARNVGTVSIAGANLRLDHDALLTFVSSVGGGTATHTGSTATWALGTLAPGETRQVDAAFTLAVSAPLGHALTATATLDPITGDLTPADNTETSVMTVTAAYDPNDISVNYATLTLPQVQQAAKSLDYTVRFQNVGTDTAFTVVLRDTLPVSQLNLGTLRMLSASHNYTWRLGAGGVLTVTFPNILLPDSTTNLQQSMGFVRFHVVPYTTLALGDLIPNAAGIYFDFNAPVVTNTALTTVANPIGLAADNAATLAGGAWPNPATGTLHVAVDLPTSGPLTLSLTDALGRVALTRSAPASAGPHRETLDVGALASGLYLLRATAGGRAFSQRVVIR